MTVSAVSSFGTYQASSLVYLEARLRSDQQKLVADQAANANEATLRADRLAVQIDRAALSSSQQASRTQTQAPAQTQTQAPAQTQTQATTQTQTQNQTENQYQYLYLGQTREQADKRNKMDIYL